MIPLNFDLHLCEEHEIAGSPWDAAIRDALCACFPADAGAFVNSRAWHGSVPAYAVFLAEDEQVVAHAAVVSRTVTSGGVSIKAAGLQGVCVRPEWRGRHLLDDLLTRAMDAAADRGYDLGLLFCLPEIESVYASRGWRRIANEPMVCRDETGREQPLPGKNIAMAYPLRMAGFPPGLLDLNGRDW